MSVQQMIEQGVSLPFGQGQASPDTIAVTRLRPIDTQKAVINLTILRQEWEKAAEQEESPLLDVTGNVGLLLVDVARALDLQGGDAWLVLGPELFRVLLEQGT